MRVIKLETLSGKEVVEQVLLLTEHSTAANSLYGLPETALILVVLDAVWPAARDDFA